MSILLTWWNLTFSLSGLGVLSPFVMAYHPSSSSPVFITLCIITFSSFS